MIIHARFRYVCRACHEHVAVAGKPPAADRQGAARPGAAGHVITSKYSGILPLYRQEDILARHVPRRRGASSAARWPRRRTC